MSLGPGDRVLPKKEVVGHKGTWWESDLASAGWNDLSDDQKFGVVQSITGACILEVYWPACRVKSYPFVDEVRDVSR